MFLGCNYLHVFNVSIRKIFKVLHSNIQYLPPWPPESDTDLQTILPIFCIKYSYNMSSFFCLPEEFLPYPSSILKIFDCACTWNCFLRAWSFIYCRQLLLVGIIFFELMCSSPNSVFSLLRNCFNKTSHIYFWDTSIANYHKYRVCTHLNHTLEYFLKLHWCWLRVCIWVYSQSEYVRAFCVIYLSCKSIVKVTAELILMTSKVIEIQWPVLL